LTTCVKSMQNHDLTWGGNRKVPGKFKVRVLTVSSFSLSILGQNASCPKTVTYRICRNECLPPNKHPPFFLVTLFSCKKLFEVICCWPVAMLFGLLPCCLAYSTTFNLNEIVYELSLWPLWLGFSLLKRPSNALADAMLMALVHNVAT